MPPPDSGAIDLAIVALLAADPLIAAELPDGVFLDEAPPGKTAFVLVSLVDEHDEPMFEGDRAFEDAIYLVKAVALSTSGADVGAAAAQIDQLLNGDALSINGYGLMAMRRDSRVRYLEVDAINTAIRWAHRGGRYQVIASAVASSS